MQNRTLAAIVTGACAATPFIGVTAAKADAPPLHRVPVAVDYVKVVKPGAMGAIPFAHPSDVQCYSGKDGQSFRQVKDRAGWAFVTRSGRSVAGWDRGTNSFYNFTKRDRVICAAWRG